MIASPLSGFVLGVFIMALLYALLRNWKPRTVNAVFGRAQMFSAAGMGLMHGTNDAQKTMGIIALALAAGTANGRLDNLPWWLSFLRVAAPEPGQTMPIALWIKVMCALVMAAGTAVRRLAHHPHAGAQDGPPAAGQRVRRGNQFGRHHRLVFALRHPGFDHAQHFGIHHGRRRRQAIQRAEVDDRRTDGLGLAADNPRLRHDRLDFYAAAADHRPRIISQRIAAPNCTCRTVETRVTSKTVRRWAASQSSICWARAEFP